MRRRAFLLGIVALFAVGQVRLALAAEASPGSGEHAAITYVAVGVTNLFYVPVKFLYAGTGAIVGGLAYILTGANEDSFSRVWDAAGGGTYWVTPSMVEGKAGVHFSGP